MPERSYAFVYDAYGNTRAIKVFCRGIGVQANNYTNKGTAFRRRERRELRIEGLVPPAVRTLADQVATCRRIFEAKGSDVERFIYVRSLFDRSVTLAHALIASDLERFLPIIYTPTVGYACRHYSSMFRAANGIHFHPGNIDMAEEILDLFRHRDIRVAVVTDNQGILGIGDQGAGGIAICLGKLMLYTQGAGIAPWHCLPISLDVGTDNEGLLADPHYLGWRHPRLAGDAYVAFVQRFARAFRTVFPNAICQWEDFSKQNAFLIRDAYLHDLISFNDDIQGTGAVALAAILAAMRLTGQRLRDQVFVVHGAGAGGIGVAEQLAAALAEEGLSPAAAAARIHTLDRRGLVTTDRDIEPYKRRFAKDPATLSWYRTAADGRLAAVVRGSAATVLIGTSGQAGAFDRQVVTAMAANTSRPVILPLSNPTERAEATPGQILAWSQGRALVATGSPFGPVTMGRRTIRVGQCNNVFVFPGLGLGVLASGAREILPAFFTAAARAVADLVPQADLRRGVLLPRLANLRRISRAVAFRVGMAAIDQGVAGLCVHSSWQHQNDPERLRILIQRAMWRPRYLPLRPS